VLPGLDNKIAWYENTDGAGTFGAQNVISTVCNECKFCICSADMDGDGDMDVCKRFLRVMIRSPGTKMMVHGTFGAQQEISTAALMYSFCVCSADLDGDGDMDVLSASYA
jgi:hypothetical protein